MTDEEFLKEFEAARLTMEQWRHRDHVRIAYLYLRRHPLEVAFKRMRDGLNTLNAAHKVPDLPERGYHDTITLAWLRLVHCALCEFGPAETADAFLDQHTQLLSKRALLLFYSRDLLMSPAAKAAFIEPDLAPLPQSRKSGKLEEASRKAR